MGARVMPIWLHDDTEEDLVGADWHQEAICGTVDSLRDIAETADFAWHVGNQLTLIAWRPDGREWRPMPDVMVHSEAGPARRKEMRALDDGVPALVVEVLSETTWRYDRDIVGGKAFGYMQVGVPEILLFDPTEEYLEHQCVGWRRGEQGYQAWQPDAAGRFQSMSLGVAFAPEGILLRVYDPEGQPIPFRGERARVLAEERRLLAEERRGQAERDAEIARLRAELRRLAGNKEESGS